MPYFKRNSLKTAIGLPQASRPHPRISLLRKNLSDFLGRLSGLFGQKKPALGLYPKAGKHGVLRVLQVQRRSMKVIVSNQADFSYGLKMSKIDLFVLPLKFVLEILFVLAKYLYS
jgi:hypothetical protein